MKQITLLILLILSFSCKKTAENSESVTIDETNTKANTIYKSEDVVPFLKFNTQFSEFEIQGLKNPQKFSLTELNEIVKENEFDFSKSDSFKYYILSTFEIAPITYKVIMYNTYGENDSKVLNIQLNSYLKDKQIDALLLDCRFTFETEYYRNFVINKNKTIDIKKISIEKLNYNEDGDIIGVKDINDTISEPIKYKMDLSGKFIRI